MTAATLHSDDDVEFTFEWYGEFLDVLVDQGYDSVGFEGAPEGELEAGALLVRHDVDLSPRNALRIGQLEADRGITSTYFFLVSNPLYNVFDASCRAVMQELDSLGHTIGVHFSTHQYWQSRPPDRSLVDRVTGERTALETVVGSIADAISFHCPPEWTLDTRFEGLVSTYEPRYFSEIGYIADSGQRWRREPPLRDRLPDRLQVLTHPGLWAETDTSYTKQVAAELTPHLRYTEASVTNQLLDGRFEPPLSEMLEQSDRPIS